jgi:hypothetical protein
VYIFDFGDSLTRSSSLIIETREKNQEQQASRGKKKLRFRIRGNPMQAYGLLAFSFLVPCMCNLQLAVVAHACLRGEEDAFRKFGVCWLHVSCMCHQTE